LFHAARQLLRRQRLDNSDITRTRTKQAYREWRSAELHAQLHEHFDVSALAGKDILDFGCGTGELSFCFAAHEPRSILGVDLSEKAVSDAQSAANTMQTDGRVAPNFVHVSGAAPLPISNQSIDIICCFDVLEHVTDVAAVLQEWNRVLRPGGRIWIWWSPWRNPFGHHLRALIPLPWIHLLFSEQTIFDACARIYDDADFVPRQWDLDESTGLRKPNKWRSTSTFEPFLNKMHRGTWEQMLRAEKFEIRRREIHGFQGPGMRRFLRPAACLPWIGELFVSFYIYELTPRAGQ